MKSQRNFKITFVASAFISDTQVFESDTYFPKRTFGKTKNELAEKTDSPDMYVRFLTNNKNNISPLRFCCLSKENNSIKKDLETNYCCRKSYYIFTNSKTFYDILEKFSQKGNLQTIKNIQFFVENSVDFETTSEAKAMQESYDPNIRSAMLYAKKSLFVSLSFGILSGLLGVISIILGIFSLTR